MRLKKLAKAGIIVFIGLFLFAQIGCKKAGKIEATITVENQCGVAVDIFIDGIYQFSIEFTSFDEIENVTQGLHALAANKRGTQEVVSTVSLDVLGAGAYLWRVETSASIKVTNNYGETVAIYADNVYHGDLEDQKSESISKVPFGDHQLDAARISDGTVVATIVISVLENKEYTWTISK